MRNKIFKVSLIFGISAAMIVPCFTNAVSSSARTLGELKAELAAYKKKVNDNEASQTKTKNEINAAKNTISKAESEIQTNQKRIEEAKKEIEQLNIEIAQTEEEIKNLIRSYEVMSGDNNYLEYIFGASSISDFIIRYSISEQLASYNDGLITSYENNIDENERLKKELAAREIELNNKIAEKEKAITSLNNQLSEFVEDAQDLRQQVKDIEASIKSYENSGCKDSDLLTACVNLVTDTGFTRPLKKGIRTSNFGYRTHPVTGQTNKFHTGIDIGGNAEGTNVYSIANGKVGMISQPAPGKKQCGGKMVYIYHSINGQLFTSTYMHLLNINVKVGQAVTAETVIGTVGGGSKTQSWESCSTGPHLHLSLAKGWYGSTYVSYSKWVANLVDPGLRQYTNIPGYGQYFYSRTW